jgi:hypothetical protein
LVQLWREIATFGAAGRVEDAIQRHDQLVRQAQQQATRIEQRRTEAKLVMDSLVEIKRSGVSDLALVRTISKHLGVRERQFSVEVVGVEPPAVSLARIENTLHAANLVTSAANGVAVGASSAVGAWALAGALGTASSGTALATLSGAAAQSATLAWFGGGAVAAGGLGVAGGAAVLGAVAAAPALATMALLAHSKANKDIADIEEKSIEIQRSLDEMLKLALIIDVAEQRTRELIDVLRKARQAFLHQYSVTHRRLYRWGWLSKAWKWFRRVCGRRFFSERETKDVQRLLEVTAQFARILDQRVFENDGSVQEI